MSPQTNSAEESAGRPKDDAARFIGEVPQHYDRGLGPILFADYAQIAARRAASFAPGRVLETAAGTGVVTRALRDHLPAAEQIIATDLNEPMLEVARTKFAPEERVAFRPADALDLPFPDGSFDLILCQFGVMFFPDKDKSYREARRVLAPDGRYIFSVWDTFEHNPFAAVVYESLNAEFKADPPTFYKTPFSYAAIDPIKASLQGAGFSDIRVDVVRLETVVPDREAFARAAVFGSPIADQIRARGGDPHAFATVLDRSLHERVIKNGRMPLQAIFFEASAG